MPAQNLASLAKLGGVPAVALGVAAIVFEAIPGALGFVPEHWRGPVLVVTILGAGILGAGALLAWVIDRGRIEQVGETHGDRSSVENQNLTKRGGRQSGRTHGKDSSVRNIMR